MITKIEKDEKQTYLSHVWDNVQDICRESLFVPGVRCIAITMEQENASLILEWVANEETRQINRTMFTFDSEEGSVLLLHMGWEQPTCVWKFDLYECNPVKTRLMSKDLLNIGAVRSLLLTRIFDEIIDYVLEELKDKS